MSATELIDVAVIGGGPAGLAATHWCARYRRRVTLFDDRRQRNRWTAATHGYLGLEGIAPHALLERAHADLRPYPHVTIDPRRVTTVERRPDAFVLRTADGGEVHALRLILATGVRDQFPPIQNFEEFYGTSVFTCPSCDGYEAQDASVVVLGDPEHSVPFVVGMLDWATTVALVVDHAVLDAHRDRYARLADVGIRVVGGTAVRFDGERGRLDSVVMDGGDHIPCKFAFCVIGHEQHSDLPAELGCIVSDEGCVVVDEQCHTSVAHVYAAGDMTAGPHLVQIAAAKGARAGIAAALSLRGEDGAPRSPRPAPEPDQVV